MILKIKQLLRNLKIVTNEKSVVKWNSSFCSLEVDTYSCDKFVRLRKVLFDSITIWLLLKSLKFYKSMNESE